jgi:fructokinase
LQAVARTSIARARVDPTGAARYDFEIEWDPRDVRPPASRILHVGSIGAWLPPGADRVLELLRTRPPGTIATFDPNIRPALIADRDDAVTRIEAAVAVADLVKLSDEDAAWLWPGVSLDEVLDRLLSLGAHAAVVTRGADGVLARSRDARVEAPGSRVDVVDTIGAGDAFMSGAIDALLARPAGADAFDAAELDALVRRGMATAAITVTRRGADPPTAADLRAM